MSFLHWIILAVLCGVIEILSLGLWFLWLAISALFVALGAYFNFLASMESQLLVFALLTSIFIIFTRPLVLKFFKSNERISNVSALIGQHGIVTQEITPLQYGQVKLNGEIWTAAAGKEIEVGTRVVVTAIDGVKLIVQKAE